MKTIIEQLPIKNFRRVHKSYIIALDRIEHVRNKIITINQQAIPIGKSYEEAFFNAYLKKIR